MIFAYSFVYILAGNNHLLGTILVLFTFLFVNLVDNSTARVKINHMVKIVLGLGVILVSINILGSVL